MCSGSFCDRAPRRIRIRANPVPPHDSSRQVPESDCETCATKSESRAREESLEPTPLLPPYRKSSCHPPKLVCSESCEPSLKVVKQTPAALEADVSLRII